MTDCRPFLLPWIHGRFRGRLAHYSLLTGGILLGKRKNCAFEGIASNINMKTKDTRGWEGCYI